MFYLGSFWFGSKIFQVLRDSQCYIYHLENRRIWLVKIGGLEMNYGPVIVLYAPAQSAIVASQWLQCHAALCALVLLCCAVLLRASFIELAQNYSVIHCDVTMALNIGSTILPGLMTISPCMARGASALRHIAWFWNYRGLIVWTMMMMMIHSISSAPFICENHIQRRLAPQIVIINFHAWKSSII